MIKTQNLTYVIINVGRVREENCSLRRKRPVKADGLFSGTPAMVKLAAVKRPLRGPWTVSRGKNRMSQRVEDRAERTKIANCSRNNFPLRPPNRKEIRQKERDFKIPRNSLNQLATASNGHWNL